MAEKKSQFDISIIDAIRDALRNIDARAWPGVAIFLALIMIEATANVVASLPDLGWIVASVVGLLFGVFMAGWHIITEREKNSVKQQSTAELIVTIIAVASIVLLVVNLIRIATGGNINWRAATSSLFPTAANIGGWDVLAILIMAFAFAVHLFGYLEWHKNDRDRAERRIHAGKMSELDSQEKNAQRAVRLAELKLMAHEAELKEITRLQKQFGDLPAAILDPIIAEARRDVRAAFEKKYNVDLDGDGRIGKGNESKPRLSPMTANAYETEKAAEKDFTKGDRPK